MNLLQINNLRQIVDCRYPHICLNREDLNQFLNIPWEKERFYPFDGKGEWWDKKGFFHNGKTSVWSCMAVARNNIQIADSGIPLAPLGKYWSREFSFAEEGSPEKIQKMMKLKAFW